MTQEDPMQVHGYIASLLKDEPSKNAKLLQLPHKRKNFDDLYFKRYFSRENKNCGIIGTIETRYANKVIQTGYTTPDASMLNDVISDMVKEEIEYVFMEASSHGLKLGRLNGLHLFGAIFTNITRDHLDFHKTMTDYLKSKFILLNYLQNHFIKIHLLQFPWTHPEPRKCIHSSKSKSKIELTTIWKRKTF